MSRPKEHRVRLTTHVLPKTAKQINKLVNKRSRELSTKGRVLDVKFETDTVEVMKKLVL